MVESTVEISFYPLAIRLCGLFASLGLKNLRHLRDVGVIIGVRSTSDIAFLGGLIFLPNSIMVISADGGVFSVIRYSPVLFSSMASLQFRPSKFMAITPTIAPYQSNW